MTPRRTYGVTHLGSHGAAARRATRRASGTLTLTIPCRAGRLRR
jgi:hypothetical protein